MFRICVDCGVSIGTRGVSAKRCLDCADVHVKKRRANYGKTLKSRLRKRELRAGLQKGILQQAFAEQEGKCFACKVEFKDLLDRHMHTDHDHQTGEFRGLLCVRCNMALGYAQDNPEILHNLAAYLTASK